LSRLQTGIAESQAFKKSDGLDSTYGSPCNANTFNMRNTVYRQARDVDAYINPSLANAH
jgi:NitT/TauT family transport system substrate-binding protein